MFDVEVQVEKLNNMKDDLKFLYTCLIEDFIEVLFRDISLLAFIFFMYKGIVFSTIWLAGLIIPSIILLIILYEEEMDFFSFGIKDIIFWDIIEIIDKKRLIKQCEEDIKLKQKELNEKSDEIVKKQEEVKVEEVKEEKDEIKDPVFKALSNCSKKCDYLSPESYEIFKNKIIEISDEYIQKRKELIIKESHKSINLSLETYSTLLKEFFGEITTLDTDINNKLEEERLIRDLMEEKRKLESQLSLQDSNEQKMILKR